MFPFCFSTRVTLQRSSTSGQPPLVTQHLTLTTGWQGPGYFDSSIIICSIRAAHQELSGLSAGPWANSTTAFQIKDISAVVVALAVIDPKSRSVLSTSQLELLAGTNGQTSPFVDFATGWTAGELLSNWQTALATNSQLVALPLQARQNIRFYERYLPLPR